MQPNEFIASQLTRTTGAPIFQGTNPFANMQYRDEDSKTSWNNGDVIVFPPDLKFGEANAEDNTLFSIPLGNGRTTPAILVTIESPNGVTNSAFWYPNQAQKTVDSLVEGRPGPRVKTTGNLHDWWKRNAPKGIEAACKALCGQRIKVTNSQLVNYLDRFDGMKPKNCLIYEYNFEGAVIPDLP